MSKFARGNAAPIFWFRGTLINGIARFSALSKVVYKAGQSKVFATFTHNTGAPPQNGSLIYAPSNQHGPSEVAIYSTNVLDVGLVEGFVVTDWDGFTRGARQRQGWHGVQGGRATLGAAGSTTVALKGAVPLTFLVLLTWSLPTTSTIAANSYLCAPDDNRVTGVGGSFSIETGQAGNNGFTVDWLAILDLPMGGELAKQLP